MYAVRGTLACRDSPGVSFMLQTHARFKRTDNTSVGYFVSAVLAAVMLYYVFKPVKRDYPHGNKKYRIHRWAERHLFWVENRQSRRDAENEGPDL